MRAVAVARWLIRYSHQTGSAEVEELARGSASISAVSLKDVGTGFLTRANAGGRRRSRRLPLGRHVFRLALKVGRWDEVLVPGGGGVQAALPRPDGATSLPRL